MRGASFRKRAGEAELWVASADGHKRSACFMPRPDATSTAPAPRRMAKYVLFTRSVEDLGRVDKSRAPPCPSSVGRMRPWSAMKCRRCAEVAQCQPAVPAWTWARAGNRIGPRRRSRNETHSEPCSCSWVWSELTCCVPAGIILRTAVATPDPHLATNGTVEVTARLVRCRKAPSSNATFTITRPSSSTRCLRFIAAKWTRKTIFVGHYNPWKSAERSGRQAGQGHWRQLKRFEAGQVHHLALEVPIDDFYMGGIVNKYFGQDTGPLYWAVWTDAE